MKVFAKELYVGQEIIGKLSIITGRLFFSTHLKKQNKPLEILKIEHSTMLFMNGRTTEIKAYILTFKEGSITVSDRQKFELNQK